MNKFKIPIERYNDDYINDDCILHEEIDIYSSILYSRFIGTKSFGLNIIKLFNHNLQYEKYK